jgi:hypothetical protein
LGHFESLGLSLARYGREFDSEKSEHVADAIIGAIIANRKLASIDLSEIHFLFYPTSFFDRILQSMEGHEGLRTVIVKAYPFVYKNADYITDLRYDEDSFDDSSNEEDFSALERLLSRNRNIVVLDKYGEVCTNGSSIDELYALNRFYNGSASSLQESTFWRAPLISTALTTGALNNFQYTALLLSNHVDMLFDYVQALDRLLVYS